MPRRHAPARTAWLVYRFVFGAGIYLHATVFTLAMIDRLGAAAGALAATPVPAPVAAPSGGAGTR